MERLKIKLTPEALEIVKKHHAFVDSIEPEAKRLEAERNAIDEKLQNFIKTARKSQRDMGDALEKAMPVDKSKEYEYIEENGEHFMVEVPTNNFKIEVGGNVLDPGLMMAALLGGLCAASDKTKDML